MPPSAYTLDFEKPLQELDRQIEELKRLGEERQIDVTTELRLLTEKLGLKQVHAIVGYSKEPVRPSLDDICRRP